MKHVWHALTLAAVVGAALAPARPAIAQAPAAASTEAASPSSAATSRQPLPNRPS
jgi:hypothetical protein